LLSADGVARGRRQAAAWRRAEAIVEIGACLDAALPQKRINENEDPAS